MNSSLLRILGIVIVAAIAGAFIQWMSDRKAASAGSLTRVLLTFKETNTGIVEVRNGESKIIYASKEAAKIFGYNPDELEGTDVSNLIPDAMALTHDVQMYYAMGLAQSDRLKTKTTAMLCKAKRFDKSEVEVVIRLYMGRHSIFAFINLAEETKYLPPQEPATDFHNLKIK